jgi:hypothetical protein
MQRIESINCGLHNYQTHSLTFITLKQSLSQKTKYGSVTRYLTVITTTQMLLVTDNAMMSRIRTVALCRSNSRSHGPCCMQLTPCPLTDLCSRTSPDSRRMGVPDPSEAGDMTVGGERGQSPGHRSCALTPPRHTNSSTMHAIQLLKTGR